MAENPIAAGLLRAHPLGVSAAMKAQRLGARWEKIPLERRRKLMHEIEEDMQKAHSLVKSALAVARHRREA